GVVVAAVADGAGSAEKGGLGAETAARAAVRSMVHGIGTQSPVAAIDWRLQLQAALAAARQAVLELAVVDDLPPRELASTLIVLIATGELAAAAQIGDGATLVRSESGELLALTRPPSDEY